MSVHRLKNIYKCNMNKWLNWKPDCSNSKLVEMEQDEFSQNEAKCFERIENQSVKEASLNARKKLFPDVHIPDTELRLIYELYRTAVIEGSVLYQCKDEEQANRWVQHFNRNLPTDRGAGVIRENELNIYSQS